MYRILLIFCLFTYQTLFCYGCWWNAPSGIVWFWWSWYNGWRDWTRNGKDTCCLGGFKGENKV